jgi:hypothetical protein
MMSALVPSHFNWPLPSAVFDSLYSTLFLLVGFSTESVMPMIPLGLKETKEIDFREPFKVSAGHYV